MKIQKKSIEGFRIVIPGFEIFSSENFNLGDAVFLF